MTEPHETVNVRYMVDDVETALDFYTERLGFEVRSSAAPAFADVTRGIRSCCSVARPAQPADPCPTAPSLAPAAGTASTYRRRHCSGG